MNVPKIHNTPVLIVLYVVNVVSALTIYLNALLLVLLLPFQTALTPDSYGPAWVYSTSVLLMIFQFYVWPLEMASYWFKPEEIKAELLFDDAVYARWKKLSMYYGIALTALTFG